MVLYSFYIFVMSGLFVYEFTSSVILIYYLLILNLLGQTVMLAMFLREIQPATYNRHYRKMGKFLGLILLYVLSVLILSLLWAVVKTDCQVERPYPYVFFLIMSGNIILFAVHTYFHKNGYWIDTSLFAMVKDRPK